MLTLNKLNRNVKHRLSYILSIFLSVLAIVMCAYLIYLNFQEIIIFKTEDKAKSIAIAVSQIIEEDIDSYNEFASISDYSKEYDTSYYNRMNVLLRDLKISTNVTYIYTIKIISSTESIYILDAEIIGSSLYSAPGDVEEVTEQDKIDFEQGFAGSSGLLNYGEWGLLINGYAPIVDSNTGQIVGFTCVDIDITSAIGEYILITVAIILIGLMFGAIFILRISSKFTKESHLDLLTNLGSREAAYRNIEKALRKKDIKALILLNLNDFKQFNNLYGQETGNYLLQDIAKFLSNHFSKRNVYRYGGDEYLIIIHKSSPLTIEQAFEQISHRLKTSWIIDRNAYVISAKTAISTAKFISTTDDALFSLDYCIRLLRTKVKTNVLYVDEPIINSIKRETTIAELMAKNIEKKDFQVNYQPIHSIKDNAFTSAEALLRLFHEDLGWIPPEEFIPIAERKGYIIDIGYIVITKVCSFINELETHDIHFESISVNLSPIQLTDLNIAKKIKNIIYIAGINPSKISFEITESAFIRDFGSVKTIMNELREFGIKFYLDDFGSGYSNLASIIRLDFKYVKLDKSLLSYSSKYRQNELIGGFIKVFNELGISVVVEGIETQEQLTIVKEHKANYIQGFYFAKPVSKDDLIVFMKSKHSS